LIVPAEAVAFKTTLPTPQLPALNTGVGIALTVKVTVEVIPHICFITEFNAVSISGHINGYTGKRKGTAAASYRT
jgi:hypothetical protein